MNQIHESFQGSLALQFIQAQGWDWKIATIPNIVLGKCPYCGKADHCYMEIRGSNDPQKQRDSLFLCQVCGKSGNLFSLKQLLGLTTPDITSTKDWSEKEKKVDPLPDVESCHVALLEDSDALDYLHNIRGLSLSIIKEQKLGLKTHRFKETGDVRALVIPYLLNGNCIWAKYRTLPDPNDLKKVPKAFAAPHGWDAVLYNGGALQEGMKEIILVEGELNTVAALDKGITNICGVPGANVKKAEWVTKLDSVEKVFIAYDKDRVGQKAAQEIASRIGINRCYKIILPDFTVTTDSGEERKGKDINEWFTHGGTAELFEVLKNEAVLFDVDGVSSTLGAMDEFIDELDNKGAGQKYMWPLVKDLVQFDEGDVIAILGPEKQGKTTLAMNLMEYMVDTYKENGVIICLEMRRTRLIRKWICHKSGIADNLTTTPESEQALAQQFKDAIPKLKELVANREGELLFCYPNYQTEEDIYKLIIDIIRRYGTKWIMLDNLQLVCDTTIRGKNRTQHLSEISKRIAKIGKDYGCQIVVLLQPHRIAENKLATSDSVDGASQVAKDVDTMLVINRNKVGEISKETFAQGGFIQTDGSFGPEMLISAGLSRYSAGGTTTVYFNGATSTVCKLTEGKIEAMTANAGVVGYEGQAKALNMPLSNLQAQLDAKNAEPSVPPSKGDGEIPI